MLSEFAKILDNATASLEGDRMLYLFAQSTFSKNGAKSNAICRSPAFGTGKTTVCTDRRSDAIGGIIP